MQTDPNFTNFLWDSRAQQVCLMLTLLIFYFLSCLDKLADHHRSCPWSILAQRASTRKNSWTAGCAFFKLLHLRTVSHAQNGVRNLDISLERRMKCYLPFTVPRMYSQNMFTGHAQCARQLHGPPSYPLQTHDLAALRIWIWDTVGGHHSSNT